MRDLPIFNFLRILRILGFVHLGFVKIMHTSVWIFWYFELVDWFQVFFFFFLIFNGAFMISVQSNMEIQNMGLKLIGCYCYNFLNFRYTYFCISIFFFFLFGDWVHYNYYFCYSCPLLFCWLYNCEMVGLCTSWMRFSRPSKLPLVAWRDWEKKIGK